MMSVLSRKVSVHGLVIAWALGAGGVFMYMQRANSSAARDRAPERTSASAVPCAYDLKRLGGYQHIKPLLYAEPVCESSRFTDLKQRINTVIGTAQHSGRITKAAVYVREFTKGEWLVVNDQARFEPGSLMKVPTMITLLKMAEEDPRLLTRSIHCDRHYNLPVDYPPSADIAVGQDYSLMELLTYSIGRSSNSAEAALLTQVKLQEYRDMCTNVGLPDFGTVTKSYPLTVQQYAQFFKALYNSSFLSPVNSDLAMDLLVHTDFADGLRRGVPASVEIAHKFGESGVVGARQLHDAGIVYGPQPYLIVVMTEGPDLNELPAVIGEISQLTYSFMDPGGAATPAPLP